MKKRRFQSQSQSQSPGSTPAGQSASSAGPSPSPAASQRSTANGGPTAGGSEPLARRAAVPAVLFGILAAFLFWADIHIMGQGGDLDARVYFPYNSVDEVDGTHIKPPPSPMELGEPIYNRLCGTCHQADGSGGVAQNCPPLVGSEWVNEKDPARIIRIVLRGASGPIDVKGKTWSGGTMTPFDEAVGDADISFILSYVRNSWGNKAPVVTPAEVAKIREAIKDKRGPFSADELLKVLLAP